MSPSILNLRTPDDIWSVSAYPGPSDIITQDEVTHLLKLCSSYWKHSGNPADPHVKLTSKKHSNGFVDVLRMLSYPNLCKMLGRQMAILATNKIKELGCEPPQWSIGSAYASITLSFAIASAMRGVRHAFTEKDPTPGSKRQLWTRFAINPTEPVMQAEELMTTSLTMNEVRKGIVDGNPYDPMFVPFVLTLINRSGTDDFQGFPILSLAQYNIDTWDSADACPLCQAGSPVIENPKQNWDKLVHTA